MKNKDKIIENAIIEYSKKCRKHCPCKKCEDRVKCQDACRNCIIKGDTCAPGYCYVNGSLFYKMIQIKENENAN